jgi:4-amino-4-deoxy-L-arabinose transferase-like glycosyltransferase
MGIGIEMKRGDTILLLALAVVVYLVVTAVVSVPGYMDADYYYATAKQLATGKGFSEPFIWNYLDNPAGIPHPSHTYWMPLTSVISAGAIYLLGDHFKAAQFPMFIAVVLLPLLTIWLAKRFGADRRLMLSAGVISIFAGFYVPYFVTTDSFAIYAWIGSAVLILAANASHQPKSSTWFWVGVLVGLGYLTRADGLLLLIPAALAVLWNDAARRKAIMMLALGFLLCAAPWFIRNLLETGHLFSTSAGRTLWLLSYNEMFSYPADILTPERWWQAGIGEIFSSRISSLGIILQRFIAEIGLVFLWPFMIVGIYLQRKRREIRLLMFYFFILLCLMMIVYPFAGAYGGIFHSGVVLLPFLWALTPLGIDHTIEWGARIRKWDVHQAKKVLGTGAIVLVILLSIGLTWSRVVGSSISSTRWQAPHRTYTQIGEQLFDLGDTADIVAVNNPPGFFLATGMQAVVIPNGTPETLKLVIDRYQVRWLILDINHPADLTSLYTGDYSPTWLELIETIQDANGEDVQIWKVRSTEAAP